MADTLRTALEGTAAAVPSAADVTHLVERPFEVFYTNAAGADVTICVGVAKTAIALTAARIIPAAALSDDATNYATWTLSTGDTAGGSLTDFDAVDSDAADGTEDWAVGTAVDFTIDTETDTVTAGEAIYLTIAHTAAGVASSGLITVDYQLAT